MAKYHTNKNGDLAVCKAKVGNCPLGDHIEAANLDDASVKKQEAVEARLSQQLDVEGFQASTLAYPNYRREVLDHALGSDRAAEIMEQLSSTSDAELACDLQADEEGAYRLPAGDYVVINTEMISVDYKDAEQARLAEQLARPAENAHRRKFGENNAYSGTVDGEPVIANTEEWSGVTNALVSRKFYNNLVNSGVHVVGETFVTLDHASDARPINVDEAKALGTLVNDEGTSGEDTETLFWRFQA